MNTPIPVSRLRFVTSNFLALQGLRQVALGIMLLLLIPALELDYPWNICAFLLLMACLGIAWWRIGMYYERRFGHVAGRARPAWWSFSKFAGWRSLVWIALCLSSLAAMELLNVKILSPGWFLGMLFAWFFTMENRRWYYLPWTVLFISLGFLVRVPEHTRLLVEIWLLPFAFMITGILDHLLLVRLLPGVQSRDAA